MRRGFRKREGARRGRMWTKRKMTQRPPYGEGSTLIRFHSCNYTVHSRNPCRRGGTKNSAGFAALRATLNRAHSHP
jgi:hypothetical protein